MKSRIEPFFVLGLLCTFAGCATVLTAAGQGVRLGKMEPSGGCRELGIVHGSGGGGGYTSSDSKMESAQNEIRNRAAEMGGNYVVMDVVGSDIMGMTLSGRAYSCPPGAAAPGGMVAVPPEGSQQAPTSARLSPEERLKRLKDLLDKGLITQQEHDSRRREILQAL